MADRSKFEKMLELLVNEDKESAQELFHELVVEKSRDIYESLLEDEDKEVDEADDEEVDESDEDLHEDDDEDLDEGFDLDEFEVEADPMDMGGDPADDMMMDLEPDDDDEDDMDDMDMDDDDEDGDVEDRIDDIEDALEDLRADFEKILSGDDEDDMDMDDEEFGGDEFGGDGEEDMDDMDIDTDDDEEKESFRFEADDKKSKMTKDDKKKKSAGEEMREYVEKIGGDRYNAYGKMGDNGTNSKSPVAKPNNMGGTTQNILRGDTEDSGEANKGALKGSPISDTSPKDMKTGNINVPGGKASKAQKKIAGGGIDNNSPLKKDSTDSSAKSPINGVKTRAK